MEIIDLSHQIALGIDIGGTTTKFGIVNLRGEILAKGVLPTDKYETIEDFVDALYDRAQPLLDQYAAKCDFIGVGIGAPNGNYYNGCIEYAPNLKWKGKINIANLIGKKFNTKATLTNDANAAAQGEMQFGAAKGLKNFIMMTLGTGVGSGIVINGQMVYGHDGFAGELGHTIIVPDGRMHWSTGFRGSLETYASATGIAITAKEFRAAHPDSLLNSTPLEEVDAKTAFECAEKGDAAALEVFRYTGEILGKALANFVMFSSPEAILFFGGVVKAGDYLLKPAYEEMEKMVLPIFQNKVKFAVSKMNESDAAILGAASLVW